jgi:hypothetical protein
VQRASKKQHLKGAAGVEASSPSTGIGASVQYPYSEVTCHHGSLMHRGLLRRPPLRLASRGHATCPRPPASSHGPPTAYVDVCHWRAQQLLGAPDPLLPREGAFVGQAPTGYYRCSGYRGIPVHLLLGHFNDPTSA